MSGIGRTVGTALGGLWRGASRPAGSAGAPLECAVTREYDRAVAGAARRWWAGDSRTRCC